MLKKQLGTDRFVYIISISMYILQNNKIMITYVIFIFFKLYSSIVY